MPRPQFPYHVPDISALARSLVRQWAGQPHPPGHVRMLNMLAKAAGFANFQELRIRSPAPRPQNVPGTSPHVLQFFDATGRLASWPGRRTRQVPCLWAVWSALPSRRTMSERDVNDAIRVAESFGDHVLLRRELVNCKLLSRRPDGSAYRRVEQQPPLEVRGLLAEIARRRAEAAR
jgi:hypothetical protein